MDRSQQSTASLLGLRNGTQGFLSWWGRELRGLLPEALTLRAPAHPPRVALAFESEHLVVYDERGGRWPWPPARVARDGAAQDDLTAALEVLDGTSGRVAVGLRLPLTDCFERKTTYPLAAQGRLRDIFEMELGRAVLFTRENSYCDFAVTNIDYAQRQIHVRQLFARKDKVDAGIAELARSGVTATFVDVADTVFGEPIAVNLLRPPASAEGRPTQTWQVSRIAGLAMIALALLAVFQALRRQDVALAQISALAEKSRSEAMEVRKQINP